MAEAPWGIVVAGVGGTGVITIGSLLGMAAHLEGKGVVTQDAAGLAQKGGATWSHIQIAERAEAIHTTRVDMAKADLVLGCDPIVAALPATLAVMRPGRTFVALSSHVAPTAAFVGNPDWQPPEARCVAALTEAAGAGSVAGFDAEKAAVALLGDSIYANSMLLGFAWQKGRVPLARAAILRAMELNGERPGENRQAFEWGRRCAHDLAAVRALYETAQVIQLVKRPGLQELVARRVEFLTAYQNAAYAGQYRDFVAQVQAAEEALGRGTRLSQAVARYLFKLMAYKDEYEVARLHTDTAFAQKIGAMFEGDYRLVHHLAPPISARKDAQGHLLKKAYGPWMHRVMGLLAQLKGLRGSWLDPFGRGEERRTERALIGEYRSCIERLLPRLREGNLALAVEIASIPEEIRGFGHVKARNLAAAREKWRRLDERFHQD